MREIKFRAWHPQEQKMWHDVGTDGCGVIILNTENMGLKPLKGEAFLMQFTGLKDKNGKEIYEGDILECNYGEYFDPFGIHYSTKRKYKFIMQSENGAINDFPEFNCEVEVIGNIYESRELLEVK